MDNKNIAKKDYFDNYFKRHIAQWQSTTQEVLEFCKLSNENEIFSFINKNKLIFRPDGATKNISFLTLAKDSNFGNASDKELLILKLIEYADDFYEDVIFYGEEAIVLWSVTTLLTSLPDRKKIVEVLNKALNKIRSYHILCALIKHFDGNANKIIDDKDICDLKDAYLLKLQELNGELFSKIKNVLDVLYRWKDWKGKNYEEPKNYLKKINIVGQDIWFSNFLINMRSKRISSVDGISYWITYEALNDFLDLTPEEIEIHRQNILSSELINSEIKAKVRTIKFILHKELGNPIV